MEAELPKTKIKTCNHLFKKGQRHLLGKQVSNGAGSVQKKSPQAERRRMTPCWAVLVTPTEAAFSTASVQYITPTSGSAAAFPLPAFVFSSCDTE